MLGRCPLWRYIGKFRAAIARRCCLLLLVISPREGRAGGGLCPLNWIAGLLADRFAFVRAVGLASWLPCRNGSCPQANWLKVAPAPPVAFCRTASRSIVLLRQAAWPTPFRAKRDGRSWDYGAVCNDARAGRDEDSKSDSKDPRKPRLRVRFQGKNRSAIRMRSKRGSKKDSSFAGIRAALLAACLMGQGKHTLSERNRSSAVPNHRA